MKGELSEKNKQIAEQNKELGEWRGLHADYKQKVNRLIEVEKKLASLPEPNPKNHPQQPQEPQQDSNKGEELPDDTEEAQQPTRLPEEGLTRK